MELTISGKDKNQLKKVEELARKMGLGFQEKKEKPSVSSNTKRQSDSLKLMEDKTEEDQIISYEDTDKAIKALKELRKINAFRDIDDAVS